jgi:hypothetical protein
LKERENEQLVLQDALEKEKLVLETEWNELDIEWQSVEDLRV